MRGEGRATPTGLLAEEGETDTGLTPPSWLRFRYAEAAASRLSLGGVTSLGGMDSMPPISDINPAPPLSIASQGLGVEKWWLAEGKIPDEPNAGLGLGQQHRGDSPGRREERTFTSAGHPVNTHPSCHLQIAGLPRNWMTSPGLSDPVTAQWLVEAGAGAQPSSCQASCCPQALCF